MYRHVGQAIVKRCVGQQGVTQPVDDFIQSLKALDDRTAIRAGQRAQRADTLALDRAGDDAIETLTRRAEVADHLSSLATGSRVGSHGQCDCFKAVMAQP